MGANARALKRDPAEHVEVRWSFANDCWEVNFQEPPTLRGRQLMCRVEDLNPFKAALVGVEDLESLDQSQKMDVAKDYLQLKAAQAVQDAM